MPVDQSGATEYEAADVLFASTEVGASSASSVLKFNHALHRINIHLKGNIPDDLSIEVKSLAGGRTSLEDREALRTASSFFRRLPRLSAERKGCCG